MNQMATGGKTDVARAIATISKAAGSSSKWLEVAKVVAFIRDEELWRGSYPSAGDWLEAAAATYGVTKNTLTRLLTAAEFLESKISKSRQQDRPIDLFAGGGTFAMATVEQIKRMHDISPSDADKAFEKHIAGKLSYRAAKRQYDELYARSKSARPDILVGNPPFAKGTVDAAKISSRRVHEQRNDLKKIIHSHVEVLSGLSAESVTISRKRIEYVSPDAIVIGNKNKSTAFVDGYAFKRLALNASKATVTKLLSEAAFSSTFFRRYWLILDAAQNELDQVVRSVDDLDLLNVGVARYVPDSQDDLALLRSPKGRPVPDRHSRAVEQILAD